MNIIELAERALDEIRRTDPVNVYAAGHNKVMATNSHNMGYNYAFRRVGKPGHWRIRFERWPTGGLSGHIVSREWLPPDLEARAAELLATMPVIRPLTPEEIASMEETSRPFGRPISS